MQFNSWEPHYREIVEYFGFDRGADEEAARLLASLLECDNLLSLASLVDGNEVTVCGNAPCLRDDLSKISGVVFAADAAAEVLDSHGIRPDAIFTDLDGATDRFIELNNEGTIIVIHAHGDNIPLLKHWVPRFKGKVVGTTQAAPSRMSIILAVSRMATGRSLPRMSWALRRSPLPGLTLMTRTLIR
jgi:uncharacterized Rossmann fold enzyme